MGGVATRAFTGVAGTITNILGKAGTAVAAGPLGKIGSVIGKGFGEIGTLIAPLQKLGGAILGPFSGILGKVLPVVGVISLIVAAVQILRDNLDKVREVVGRVFGDAGLVIFDKVVAAITNIGDTIRNVFTDGNLGGARQFLINLFGEEATGVIDGAITILQTVWNILSGFIEFVNTYVRPIVEQIFSFIVGTVLPQIAQAFAVWQADLRAHHHVAAELIANPREYAEYFAGYEEALALEAQLAPLRAMDVKASEYPKYRRMVDGEGIDVSALESVRGDGKSEEVKSGEVNEEVKEEDVKTEEMKEEKEEEVKEEVKEETVKTDNPETETDNVEEEFEAIIGSEEGTDDGDIDIDDLEKEWS